MKRAFDIIVSATGLVMLAPVLGLIALAVRFRMGGPVLFRQTRPGLHGQPFQLVKFRTMITDESVPEDMRITSLGAFMRASSLDELPELWNVLKGDMSLVGPRPLLMEYLPLYSPTEARRHEVRPGITGWAQIQGRNALSWAHKFHLDVWYVDHHTLWLDLKILFATFGKVFRREGVNHSHNVTMTKFTGNKEAA